MARRTTLLAMQDDDPFTEFEGAETLTEQPTFRPAVIDSLVERAGAIYAM